MASGSPRITQSASTTLTTRQSSPTHSIVALHPSPSSTSVKRGTRTNWPSDIPAVARLIAVPRRRSNHLLSKAPKSALVVPPSPAAEITP